MTRNLSGLFRVAIYFLSVSVCSSAFSSTVEDISESNTGAKNYTYPLLYMLGINVVIGLNANYVFHKDYARISVDSIATNFRTGLTWDDDDFLVNQLGHPYQGGLYHSSARSFGFNFWESIPYTALGSLQWEFMMETQAPAVNDFITTTLSGAMFGEVSFRLAHELIKRAPPTTRSILRELGVGAINPVLGFKRNLLRGASYGYVRGRHDFGADLAIGISDEIVDDYDNERTWHYNFRMQAEYGDAFQSSYKIDPFDYFNFSVMLKVSDPDLIVHGAITGLLYKTPLYLAGPNKNYFGIFQNFDFYGKRLRELAEIEEAINPDTNSDKYYHLQNSAYKVGATSIGVGLVSNITLFPEYTLRTFVQGVGIPLGGINSVYATEAGRLYNLGPGWGLKLDSRLYLSRYAQLFVSSNIFHIDSLSGGDGTENVRITTTGVRVPLARSMSISLEMMFYRRLGEYDKLPSVSDEHDAIQSLLSYRF